MSIEKSTDSTFDPAFWYLSLALTLTRKSACPCSSKSAPASQVIVLLPVETPNPTSPLTEVSVTSQVPPESSEISISTKVSVEVSSERS